MSSPQLPIPMAKDVARAIGGYGEKIENRSLLLEKFPSQKVMVIFKNQTQLQKINP